MFRDRRLTWAEVDRADPAAGQPPHRARARLPRRAVGAAPDTRPARTTWRSTSTTATSTSRRCSARSRRGVAPFNVNYRYVAEELRYLLDDAARHGDRRALALRADARRGAARAARPARDPPGRRRLGPRPAARRGRGTRTRSRRPSPDAPPSTAQPRRPLHPLHRRHHRHAQGRAVAQRRRHRRVLRRLADGVRRVDELRAPRPTAGLRALLAPPFMHGAGHWVAFGTWLGGGTVFVQSIPERLDPADIWAHRRARADRTSCSIVGDAFARPLLDELDRARPTTCPASPCCCRAARRCRRTLKEELLAPPADADDRRRARLVGGRRPAVARVDRRRAPRRARSRSRPATTCCRADLDRVLEPGDDELGWLAKSGRLALGYLGDAEKTAAHVSRSSTACGTRCPATGPGCAPTA